MKWMIFIGGLFFSGMLLGEEIRPVEVWTSAEVLGPEFSIKNMIDGDLATCAALLDDSRTGKSEQTIPRYGANPTTCTFVLDLGSVRKFKGMKFMAPGYNAPLMASNVTVFLCDDLEGKTGVRPIAENRGLISTRNNYAAFLDFGTVVEGRYVGVKVNASWEQAIGGEDGWINIRAVCRQKGMPVSGLGDRFLVQFAEVSCYLEEPVDRRAPNPSNRAIAPERLFRDWLYQDYGLDVSLCFHSSENSALEKGLVEKVLVELRGWDVDCEAIAREMEGLVREKVPGNDSRWKELYRKACQQRRILRLQYLLGKTNQFLYVKHFVFGGGVIIEFTEYQIDRQMPLYGDKTKEFRPGSQLCLATILPNGEIQHEVLIHKPNGLIRDPALSYDAKTVVFSMRDNFQTENFHLYKMDMTTRKVEQITFDSEKDGKPVYCSDTEPCITPEGKIVFQSTRGGLMDICWPMRCSNLYTCDMDGKEIVRLGFDQLHTLYPQVQEDGRITFTRWEYNDRNATFIQPLMVMNPDGTSQTEYYGNNSWYPTSIIHARGVPGSHKAIAVISGHHVLHKGKLALIDRNKGTQENDGIEFVAGSSPDNKPGRQPSNAPKIDREVFEIDVYGHDGPQFQYPFAFDEEHYLVGFNPEGYFSQYPWCYPPFGVYFMDVEGRRELLAFDWSISCCQAIPVMERPVPIQKISPIDMTANTGFFYVQNVYLGPGLEGVPVGTIRRLRVIALEYRAARVGMGSNRGVGGWGNVFTPISFNSGSWDVKHVLGEVAVESDGSAFFEVPARTPVYFQLLDEKGRCVQTMRSWATLQPGEQFACLGCHENKNDVGLVSQMRPTMAMKKPIQKLRPLGEKQHPWMERLETENYLDSLELFLGIQQPCDLTPDAPVDGFSYMQEIQPIWEKHCVECHTGNVQHPDPKKASSLALTGEFIETKDRVLRKNMDDHKRNYARSYLELTDNGNHNGSRWVSWIQSRSQSDMIPPYFRGSVKSSLMDYLEPSHYDVQVSDMEKRKVACWIDLCVPFAGSYAQHHTWTEAEKEEYDYFQQKRVHFAREELENIRQSLK